MKKLFILIAIILISSCNSFAVEEKLPIKIAPLEPISTAYDETEVGDRVPFLVLEDVYKNNKVFIKKDTTLYGTVDFVKENGWFGDNAEVEFKIFRVRNAQGKLTTFTSNLTLTGFNTLKWYNPAWKRFFNYCSLVFRGNEVDINPNISDPIFNIWYNE